MASPMSFLRALTPSRLAIGAVAGTATLFNLPAFFVMIAITTLLSLGVRESTRINNIMVAIKLLAPALAAGCTAATSTPVRCVRSS